MQKSWKGRMWVGLVAAAVLNAAAAAHADVLFGPVQPSIVTCRVQLIGAQAQSVWLDLVDGASGETVSGIGCGLTPMEPGAYCQLNAPVPYVTNADTRYLCAFVTDGPTENLVILTPDVSGQ